MAQNSVRHLTTQQIKAFVDETLTEPDETEVDRHLEDCQTCREEIKNGLRAKQNILTQAETETN